MSSNHKFAWALSLAGLIPFWALVIWLLVFGAEAADNFVMLALKAYGAAILSFMGGIRWGAALNGPGWQKPVILGLSVVPSLVGWVALLLPDKVSLLVLISGFAAQAVWDVSSAKSGQLPSWFGQLRMVVSVLVILALSLALYIIS